MFRFGHSGSPVLLYEEQACTVVSTVCVEKINTGNWTPNGSSEKVRECDAWPYGLREFDNSNHLEFCVFENKPRSCESISVLTISENSEFTPKE